MLTTSPKGEKRCPRWTAHAEQCELKAGHTHKIPCVSASDGFRGVWPQERPIVDPAGESDGE